jgi:cellulose synthase/poly-beta-1,6-N-acetylglucosamine synthase-like glycosyltransferase
MWLTRVGILVTLGAFTAFGVEYLRVVATHRAPGELAQAAVFLLVVSFLVYGGLVYLTSRLGWLRRKLEFRHAEAAELHAFCSGTPASLAILIPSYKEEAHVVRHTLLSAALQDYPRRQVVLLIDDPPEPSGPEDRASIQASRALVHELNELLGGARREFQAAYEAAHARLAAGAFYPAREALALARLHERASEWFARRADAYPSRDHAERLFVERNLRNPAAAHLETAGELRRNACERQQDLLESELLSHYRRLAWLFDVELTSFERKRYRNLSHAPNKAMNLNSYLALMGGRYRERRSGRALELCPVPAGEEGLEFEDADYVLTLDADSLLEPDYAARLVQWLESPENERIAVAQTPYSAIPGASRIIERIAGATTDIQYFIHQGFTRHRATFWVGANAVLRKRALEDIATTVTNPETGASHRRYIQDRTVIEDTESSVDLVRQGWQLFNYPARLSYSATPPDFGALVIQRRRWANGGLLIMPKLLALLVRRPLRRRSPEAFMRVHYLTSIAAVNVGLVLLFLFPFTDWLANEWLPLTALAYFCLYAHDLRLAGYRRLDLFQVYALNLMLIPVNLGGVFRSLQQAVTKRTATFGRTPKVTNRTAAPAIYVLAPYALTAYLCSAACFDLFEGEVFRAIASGINASLLFYAITTFVGWRDSAADIVRKPRSRLRAGV